MVVVPDNTELNIKVWAHGSSESLITEKLSYKFVMFETGGAREEEEADDGIRSDEKLKSEK